MKKALLFGCVTAGFLLIVGNVGSQTVLGPAPVCSGNFGDPLPGLNATQTAAFVAGSNQFVEVDQIANGLGPIFNGNSCAACHNVPAIGGGGAASITETRFGLNKNGVFDPMTYLGGSLQQQFAITLNGNQCTVETNPYPVYANVTAQRTPTPLFGLGLVEAIPDCAILANEAFQRLCHPDGISGHAVRVLDVGSTDKCGRNPIRIGRFGWKAQQPTLLDFSGDAYVNEMGVTSRLFPLENVPNGPPAAYPEVACDEVPDPEDIPGPDGKADIDRFADFMRLLNRPPTLPETPATRSGGFVFNAIGCSICHVPVMITGPNAIKALNLNLVPLFSDLLVHDMGSLNDGIAQGDAGTNQMRTALLWGLRASAPYLHDGRAATIEDAIKAHDGEAAVARDRFLRLSPVLRSNLVKYLESN